MRIRIGTVTVAALVAIALVGDVPRALAGENRGICNSVPSDRISIPSNFAVDACFDGEKVYLKNSTELVLKVSVGGAAYGLERSLSPLPPTAGLILRDVTDASILGPGDTLKISIGDGSGTIGVSTGTNWDGFYAVASILMQFWPEEELVITSYDLAATLVSELWSAYQSYKNCMSKGKRLGSVRCRLGLGWDVNFAIDRFAAHAGAAAAKLAKKVAGELISAMLGTVDVILLAYNRVRDANRIKDASRSMNIQAATPPPSQGPLAPSAPTPTGKKPTPTGKNSSGNSGKPPTTGDTTVGVTPEKPPPPPTASASLAKGPVAPFGFRYSIGLQNFPANATVSITCYDTVSPGGFYSFTLQTNGAGAASTASYCYSADGPDHWFRANGVESNHVSW
jgi:hypothetical protein